MSLRRLRLALWAVVVVAAIASAGLAVYRVRQGHVPRAKTTTASVDLHSPLVGHKLPALHLVDLNGHAVSPDKLGGKPILMNFWATWCIPCRAEMPDLEHESLVWKTKVTVVGVDDGEDAATIQPFIQDLGVTYTIWRDPELQVEKVLQAPGLPYTIFLDQHGIVRTIHVGQMDRAYIDQRLRSLAGTS